MKLNPNNIICIQEHWLYNFQLKNLTDLFPTLQWAVKCIDDNSPIAPLYRPRGHFGVACAWHPSIDQFIKLLPDGSNSIIALQVKSANTSMVLINSYLPTVGSHTGTRYDDVTDEILEIMHKYHPHNKLIWVGDINGDPDRGTSSNDRSLIKFCNDNDLKVSEKMPHCSTFYHFNKISQSMLDLVITPKQEHGIIKSICIDVRNPVNTSCHDAVFVKTSLDVPTSCATSTHNCLPTKTVPRRLKWDKVHVST